MIKQGICQTLDQEVRKETSAQFATPGFQRIFQFLVVYKGTPILVTTTFSGKP